MSHLDDTVDGQDLEQIRKLFLQYKDDKKPLEYILGYVTIGDISVKVNENVLIPRPETEYMIEAAADFLSEKKGYIVADIGT